MSVNMKIIRGLIQSKPPPPELPARMDDRPDGWREEYEERAAILEYDGMMNRPQAEEWAETIIRAAYRRNQG